MSSTKSALRELYPGRYEVPALIAGAAVLLAFGLSVPLFSVTKLILWRSSYSITTGVLHLYRENEIFLATIIMVFSIIFPVLKLVALAAIWTVRLSDEQRTKGLRWLGSLGKWSMLDVLVVAIMILAIKLRVLSEFEVGPGLYVFCGAIVLSMLASTMVERLGREVSACGTVRQPI